MSIERELGQIHEAIFNLKKSQDLMRDEVCQLSGKLDSHMELFSNLRMKVAGISATVSLIVAGVFAFISKAISE